jgi:hypothetical protein
LAFSQPLESSQNEARPSPNRMRGRGRGEGGGGGKARLELELARGELPSEGRRRRLGALPTLAQRAVPEARFALPSQKKRHQILV